MSPTPKLLPPLHTFHHRSLDTGHPAPHYYCPARTSDNRLPKGPGVVSFERKGDVVERFVLLIHSTHLLRGSALDRIAPSRWPKFYDSKYLRNRGGGSFRPSASGRKGRGIRLAWTVSGKLARALNKGEKKWTSAFYGDEELERGQLLIELEANQGIFEAFGQNRRINRGRTVTINGLTVDWGMAGTG